MARSMVHPELGINEVEFVYSLLADMAKVKQASSLIGGKGGFLYVESFII